MKNQKGNGSFRRRAALQNSGFHYGYFAGTNGYDLRFGTNATPPETGLNYEIESWNPVGASYVWVQRSAGWKRA